MRLVDVSAGARCSGIVALKCSSTTIDSWESRHSREDWMVSDVICVRIEGDVCSPIVSLSKEYASSLRLSVVTSGVDSMEAAGRMLAVASASPQARMRTLKGTKPTEGPTGKKIESKRISQLQSNGGAPMAACAPLISSSKMPLGPPDTRTYAEKYLTTDF